MKKLLLTVLLATALLAAACGDDGDDADIGSDTGDDGTVVDGGDDAPTDDTPSDDPPADDGDLPTDDGDLPVDDGDLPVDDLPPDGGDDLPLGGGPYPIADLTITYQLDDSSDAVSYRLACLGDTATITGDGAPGAAADQCLALNDPAIRDRVLLGPPADIACTEIYGGPQTATISGTLDDQPVDASFDRANGCGIADWDLLGAFFPAAA